MNIPDELAMIERQIAGVRAKYQAWADDNPDSMTYHMADQGGSTLADYREADELRPLLAMREYLRGLGAVSGHGTLLPIPDDPRFRELGRGLARLGRDERSALGVVARVREALGAVLPSVLVAGSQPDRSSRCPVLPR